MNTLFLGLRCRLFKRIASILLFCSLVVLCFSPSIASAHPMAVHAQFSTQARIGFKSGDDWEPAITTDRYGHVYALYKHFNVKGGQRCDGCRNHLLFQRSDDEGQTWSDPRPVAPGPYTGKSGQDDPQIMVDPVDGRTVWASFMQNFPDTKIEITKSTNFGETWSMPVVISAAPHKSQVFDKDELVVQGKTIAVAYDDGFNTWCSVSLDGGKHWAVHEVFPGSNKFGMSLAAGAVINLAWQYLYQLEQF